jgi:hypothetical protein
MDGSLSWAGSRYRDAWQTRRTVTLDAHSLSLLRIRICMYHNRAYLIFISNALLWVSLSCSVSSGLEAYSKRRLLTKHPARETRWCFYNGEQTMSSLIVIYRDCSSKTMLNKLFTIAHSAYFPADQPNWMVASWTGEPGDFWVQASFIGPGSTFERASITFSASESEAQFVIITNVVALKFRSLCVTQHAYRS